MRFIDGHHVSGKISVSISQEKHILIEYVFQSFIGAYPAGHFSL